MFILKNVFPPQFSVHCIFFCDISAHHTSSYSIHSLLPKFSFLLLSSAFHSSIIFEILSLPILLKYPNHLKFLSSITWIILWWTFIISIILIFLIFSIIDFLATLSQKPISLGNSLFAFSLFSVKLSGPYDMRFCTNDLKIKSLDFILNSLAL